jgi:Pin2-interacting protein X1
MGLAAPRKRLKIAHDPRNTAWTTSTTSIGHRLMTQQGWSAGQALGANTPTSSSSGTSTPSTSDEARLLASRVGVLFKDDTLGLGAKLASKDPAHARTGLDAFQGLLGRLNARDEEEVKIVERKESERKLEGYARGKWGMVFVPGGVLVRGEEYGSQKEAKDKATEPEEERREEAGGEEGADKVKRDERRRRKEERRKRKLLEEASSTESGAVDAAKTATDEKAEKRRRKEERRKRKEERRAEKSSKEASSESTPVPTIATEHEQIVPAPRAEPIPTSKSTPANAKPSATPNTTTSSIPASTSARTGSVQRGRQILRSRNIDAKRRAFADDKGLDGIFMRSSASASA